MCPPSGPFYRVAGMSYVRYANLCADYLRGVMKEPFKTKALARQVVYFRESPFVDGKAGASSECWGAAAAGAERGSLRLGTLRPSRCFPRSSLVFTRARTTCVPSMGSPSSLRRRPPTCVHPLHCPDTATTLYH